MASWNLSDSINFFTSSSSFEMINIPSLKLIDEFLFYLAHFTNKMSESLLQIYFFEYLFIMFLDIINEKKVKFKF